LVNYRSHDLDAVFASLSDSTRRAMLTRLARQESLTVSELAEPFSMTLPAVMKHLDVLDNAGLITRSKQGRTVEVRLSTAPLRGATEWLGRYERFWSPTLDRLAAYAERKEAGVRAAEARAKGKAR
jgi:DNA-binding transcriptional ArsR family regulator